MSERVLVTGGAGFIGSHLVRRLLTENYSVSILVKDSTDLWRLENLECLDYNAHCICSKKTCESEASLISKQKNSEHYSKCCSDIKNKINLVKADLKNIEELKKVMKELQPDGVFHLAASNIASGVTAPDQEVLLTNLLGTKNLIDSLKEIDYKFFVNTGSFMEYGPKNHAVKESEICEPTELYSISKLGATLYGQAVAKKENKPIATLRIFTPYGPMVQPGRLVYEVINRALRGDDIEVTNKEVSRDFIYVEDLMDLYLAVAGKVRENPGVVVNAGSGEPVSIETLVNLTLELISSKSNVKWGDKPILAYDSKLWQADTSLAKKLGWTPKHSLETGLKKTIDYYQSRM